MSDRSPGKSPNSQATVKGEQWDIEELKARERMFVRGQRSGMFALVMLLSAVVLLAILGQPAVAAVLAGSTTVAIVAIFVTGRFVPSPLAQPVLPSQRKFGRRDRYASRR